MSSPEPFQLDPKPSRPGCGKAAVIGCGALFVLLLVVGIVSMFKVKELTAWGFGVMEKQVMARLPADTSDETARRIRRGFEAVTRAVQEDRVEPNALEQLQPIVLRFADPNRSPRPEDVERLITLLEAASGEAPAAIPEPDAQPETAPDPELGGVPSVAETSP
jgi:hypothetical protein